MGDTILASPLRARGLRYPTWAFIPTRFISRQTLFTPALLPAIPQVHMDLAITINATGLQPELFDLSRQSQIYLVALRMRLLKLGSKSHWDEHPAPDRADEQASNCCCHG